MLFIDPGEVTIIPAGRTKCVGGRACGRYASWEMKASDGESLVPFCGWCVMYGASEWAVLNRDELSHAGEYVLAESRRSHSRTKVTPELDEMHRLDPDCADRYIMGIVSTSRLLSQGPLGRLAQIAEEVDSELDGTG